MDDESVQETLTLILKRIATNTDLIQHDGTFLLRLFSGLEQDLLVSLEDEELQLTELYILNIALQTAEEHFEVIVTCPYPHLMS